MNLYLEFAFLILCIVIACWDFLFYKIPNSLLLGLLGVAVLHKLAGPMDAHALMWSFGVAVIVLLVGYALFAFKFLGAGDGKYMAVAALFFPASKVLTFLILMSFAGAILALIYKFASPHVNVFKKLIGEQLPKGYEVVEETGKTIPYGVAISAGIIGAYFLIGS